MDNTRLRRRGQGRAAEEHKGDGLGWTGGTVTGKGPGADTGRVQRTHGQKTEEEQ